MKDAIRKFSKHKQLFFGFAIGLAIALPTSLYINEARKNNLTIKPEVNTQSVQSQIKVQPTNVKELNESSNTNSTNDRSPANVNAYSTQKVNNATPTQQAPNITTITPKPTCNEQLKAAYTQKRDADIQAENAKYASFIPTGPIDSSYRAASQSNEDTRHQAALAQIEADYQIKLATIYCVN